MFCFVFLGHHLSNTYYMRDLFVQHSELGVISYSQFKTGSQGHREVKQRLKIPGSGQVKPWPQVCLIPYPVQAISHNSDIILRWPALFFYGATITFSFVFPLFSPYLTSQAIFTDFWTVFINTSFNDQQEDIWSLFPHSTRTNWALRRTI